MTRSWYMLSRSGTIQRAARHPRAGGGAAAAQRLSFFPAPTRPAILGGGQLGFRHHGGNRVCLWPPRLARDRAAGHHRRLWPFAWRGRRRRRRCRAWTEPALASHNRQLAIFITAVGALIAAAALITGGLGGADRSCRAALGVG